MTPVATQVPDFFSARLACWQVWVTDQHHALPGRIEVPFVVSNVLRLLEPEYSSLHHLLSQRITMTVERLVGQMLERCRREEWIDPWTAPRGVVEFYLLELLSLCQRYPAGTWTVHAIAERKYR